MRDEDDGVGDTSLEVCCRIDREQGRDGRYSADDRGAVGVEEQRSSCRRLGGR